MKDSILIQQKYRRLFKDIIKGYCLVEYKGKTCYAKHFKEIDFGLLEEEGERQKNHAIGKGLLTEEGKIEMLTKAGHWDQNDEDRYEHLGGELSNLRLASSKIFIASQRKGIESEIEELEKEYAPLKESRIELVGITAEKFAEKKKNEIFVRLSLYKDEELRSLLFEEGEFEEMTPDELAEVIFAFNISMGELDGQVSAAIATQPFFMNSFFLCKDNPQAYYGKAIIELTTYQVELFSKGTFYKSILSKGKMPPETYYEDIDKLINWYDLQSDSGGSAESSDPEGRRTSKATNSQARGIVGATKEEAQAFASKEGEGEVTDLLSAARKMKEEKGKDKLDIYDMAELHGLLEK